MALFRGLFLAVLGEFLAPEVVRMLEVPEDVYPLAVKYLRIYLAGIQGMIFSFANIIIQSAVNSLSTTVMAAVILAVTLLVKPSRRYIEQAGT